jgi:hypothetical protein
MIKINIKKGVVFNVIAYEFCTLARIIFRVYQKYGAIPTCTSANDGKHATNSWHYFDLGWDWRIWGLSDPQAVADELRQELQAIDFHYDVVFGDPQHLDHIHTEYDLNKKQKGGN